MDPVDPGTSGPSSGSLLTSGFRDGMAIDVGTSVSARHPNATALVVNFPPEQDSAALMVSLPH